MSMTAAVAYYRTSSASNVAGDSEQRQRDAVMEYAARVGDRIEQEFYDAAVSGTDPIDSRPGFVQLLQYCEANDVHTIYVENASRFARDLLVQLAGHETLKRLGIALVPVDAPTTFTDPSPTAVMVQQILGAVAQFEKAVLVAKLKHARDAKRAATGRCEGRKPVPEHVVARAQQFARHGLSLREVGAALAQEGYVAPSGKRYGPSSIRNMLEV